MSDEFENEEIKALGELEQQSAAASDEERAALEQVRSASVSSELKSEESGQKEEDIRKLIGEMNIAQKIKTAMLGNATCRGLLVFDPIRMVSLAVIKNPRLQIKEVVEFSRNKNLAEYVLREISMKKEFASDYKVRVNLVCNPKSPKDVALKWLKYLQKNDLRNVSRSREVPGVIATAARKRLAVIDKR